MNYLRCLLFVAILVSGCSQSPKPPPEREPEHPSPPAKQPEAASKDDAAKKPEPKDDAAKKPEKKNIVVLTPAASAQVRKLMKENLFRYLRVSVSDANEYKLHLEGSADPEKDYLGESRGVQVVIDRKSAESLPAGIVVDFVNEKGTTGFKFTSPEPEKTPADTSVSLVEARKGFKTKLARKERGGKPAATPPAKLFQIVRYDAPAGKFVAYLTPDPKDDKKHPAIIWITGGDCNSIDAGCWQEQPASNDQSASAYRKAGIIMMFPALRGGNDNPGVKEGFLSEVDDVLAAADFLRKQSYVDPERIYLGGHSTGGTLVLLTAECSDRFRAVFSFGPVEDVLGYGPRYNPFVLSDRKELQLRAPGRWLHSIKSPVFVFEGTEGNVNSLKGMMRASKNPKVQFFEVKGTDHFGVLAPVNRLIADRILQDTGPACRLAFTAAEVNKLFGK